MFNKINKEAKRNIAYEILIFFIMLALVMLVLRFWPVLILMVLGIFAAALRLLFKSTEKVEIIAPLPPLGNEPAIPETEQDILRYAFALIQMRITGEVSAIHPSARWQWYTPNPMAHIEQGDAVTIILNGAGGYRKAVVLISNLMYKGLQYVTVEDSAEITVCHPEDIDPGLSADESAPREPAKAEQEQMSSIADAPEQINYGYLAFEWVDAHLFELNDRSNESIGRGKKTLLIPTAELPAKDSWPQICKELINNDFADAVSHDDGILVSLQQ